MRIIPVTSRIIEAVSFRDADGLLWIKFRNGKERVFSGVPAETVDTLSRAPSPGQYYLDHIRKTFSRTAA